MVLSGSYEYHYFTVVLAVENLPQLLAQEM